MTHDEEVCLRLGQEIVRMIRDLHALPPGDLAYARRHVTFPGGDVHILVANSQRLADIMELAAANHYDVTDSTPRSKAQ